ncbi:MAG: DUF2911 domain-containing protein [Vicinamibacteria bacterium]
MLQRKAVLAFLLVAAASPALAHGAPRGEAKATVAGKAVSIDYGRPSLAGRDMLGKAEVGKAWRMGADAATTLKTDADLTFGSSKVPKGSYVLTATRTSETEWALNVTKAEGDKDKSKVADVSFVVGKLAESVEEFTIELRGDKDKGEIELQWGTTSLKAAFTGK